MLRLDEAVLDRLEHRLHGGERGAKVVARPRDELRACVEQLLDAGRHLVEGGRELRQLRRPVLGRARRKVTAGDRGGRPANPVERPQDRAANQQRRSEGGRRAAGRDEQDVEVVVGVEHDDTREQHRGEGEGDGDEAEPGQLQADRGQPAQGERGEEPRGERSERDDDRERDHGENR